MKTHRSLWLLLGLVLLTAAACGGKEAKTEGKEAKAGGESADAGTPPAGAPAAEATTPAADAAPQQPMEPAAGHDAANVPKEDRDDFDKFVNDVEKGLALAAQLKALVEHEYKERGTLPRSSDDLGAAARSVPATDGVESVRFSDGRIVVAYEAHGNHAAGTIELQPVVEGSTIVWNCSGGSLADTYRPANCR